MFQISVLLSELFELFEYFCVLFLVNLLIIVNYFLTTFNFFPQHLKFRNFISLYFSDHGLKISIWTVFQKNREDLPQSFADGLTSHFFE